MKNGLSQIHQLCIERNLPFVSFRLPQDSHATTYIQRGLGDRKGSLKEIAAESGFIMAPFDTHNGHPYLTVRPDVVLEGHQIDNKDLEKVKALPAHPAPPWNGPKPVVTGRDRYMEQVQDIKSRICTGAFQKAVLSRIRLIEGAYMDRIPRIFNAVCKMHPNAFVYLFKSGSQFWMGASPEPLLRLRDGRLSTVSLAGTRPHAKEHMDINRWTAKEVLEQEYVTQYIHEAIRSFGIKDYRVSSPYVKKAGNLVHIRTDFSLAREHLGEKLWELVEALHPTPAVAGQPKEDAIEFIKQLEPHDRAYYTGFLGPVKGDKDLDLFVNLRCMKIHPAYLSLYVGGGITQDSDPADEYAETTWKAESVLKTLRTYITHLEAGDVPTITYR